jgi:hypothetical protein
VALVDQRGDDREGEALLVGQVGEVGFGDAGGDLDSGRGVGGVGVDVAGHFRPPRAVAVA